MLEESSSFDSLEALIEVFSRDEEDEVESKKSLEEENEEFEMKFSGTRISDDELERNEGIYRDKDNGDDISGDIDDIISGQHERRLRWLSKRPMEEYDDEVMVKSKKRKVWDVEEESSDEDIPKYYDDEYFESLKKLRKNDCASTSRTSRRSLRSSGYDKEYFECVKITRKTNYGASTSRSSRKDLKCKEECYEFVKKTRMKNDGSRTSKRKSRKSGSRSRPMKKKGGTPVNPPPPLPANVRAAMEEDGPIYEEPVLVTQRVLTGTDLKKHQNRLQIPFHQMFHTNFISENELMFLREETEQVQRNGELKMTRTPQHAGIIMPSLARGIVKYTIWDMRTSSMLAFNGDWYNLVRREKEAGKELKVNMVLQIWAYRVHGNLRFALVNLGHLDDIVQVQRPGDSNDSYEEHDSIEDGEDDTSAEHD